MAYIGKDLPGILNHNKLFETFTGDGIITSKVLSRTPGSVNNVDVFYDGAFQTPGVDFTLSGNTITFTSAPPNGVVVSILAGEDSQVITPEENTVTSAKIVNNTITNALLPSTIPSTKLSGSALPAIDGSNLQNVSTGLLSGSSDPTITQNPAGGVGTVYTNTTDGEVFVLTDATTNENVWVNVGGGSGNVNNNFPYTLGGTQYGYAAGGLKHGPANTISNKIDRFAFAASANATDVGDLSKYRRYQGMTSSATHGYSMGGEQADVHTANSAPKTNKVDKFQYAASSNAVASSSDLSESKTSMTNGIIHNSTHGFTAGGSTTGSITSTIEKWQFSTDAVSNSSADLSVGVNSSAAGCGNTHGYAFGGSNITNRNVIQKFSMSSNTNASLLSSITVYSKSGQNSWNAPNTTYIWGSGWVSPNGGTGKKIEKFNLTTENNSSLIGELFDHTGTPTGAIDYWVGVASSSTTHGYRMFGGGGDPIPTGISRFSFSTESTMTDVGDMTTDSEHANGGREDGTAFYH